MCRLLYALSLLVVLSPLSSAEDWRVWRGPTLDNHAPASAADSIPVSWSSSQNVIWKSPIPGSGHASPIVVDSRVFVLTHESDSKTISLLRYDLEDGARSGRVVLHEGVEPPKYLHKKNTCASGTPASDGKAVYVAVQVNDTIQASAVSLDGTILWQRTVAPYQVSSKFWFGYGSSPLLTNDSVVVAVDVDNDDRGLYAFDKTTGEPKWRAARPSHASYSSPILADVDGKQQIVISGGALVASYDPETGRELWSI
ncbi:MAG: PQQ-binding-like beta-propeller repeat protein, partial [Rhodopirellula sp. JB044]|uniref:outer membrane protein assembly factor BamB family protein n=1 Tax=Rhodopirellula sp. JB044 TaxID=3342844 RepID=UPI003709F422